MRFLRSPSLSVVRCAPSCPPVDQSKNADRKGPRSTSDLDIALDVAVHAAVQKTGATGVAIALMDNNGVLACRARIGEIAPRLGAALNISSGITGACVREARLLTCEDTERDQRVDAEVCRSLGIRSIVAIPILVDGAVAGLLEVLSNRPLAFTAAHVDWLQKVGGLVRTLACRQESIVPAAQRNVIPEVTAEVARASEQLPALTSIPKIAKKAFPESAGVDAVRDLLDKTAQTSNWEDICQQLVSQLQK